MRQLNKLKVAIAIGIIFLIIIAIIAVIFICNNNTYFSKETSTNTIVTTHDNNNGAENNQNNSDNAEIIVIEDEKNSSTTENIVNEVGEENNNQNDTRKIDPNKPMVALTFDDGPNATATPRILDTLERYNSVATFFDLGICMKKYPKITQREKAIGCEVGSHTYSHKNLNKLTKKEIEDDINAAASIYENTLGEKLKLVRPPYGNANDTVKKTLNYALINWDVDTLDWKTKNADKILEEIRGYKTLDGRILLMHSIYGSTADAIEILVPELINKGYQLVTVSEMAQYKGYQIQNGNIYYNFR